MGIERAFWDTFSCQVGQEVFCPLSGLKCTGGECCPGVVETGGLAFPCPSAPSTSCTCSNRTKLQDCTTTPSQAPPPCTGTCNAAHCNMLAMQMNGWQGVCNGMGVGDCDGCKPCCDLAASTTTTTL